MTIFKRIMSFVLALVMVAGMMPVTQTHAEALEEIQTVETVPAETEATAGSEDLQETEAVAALTKEPVLPEEETAPETMPTESADPDAILGTGSCTLPGWDESGEEMTQQYLHYLFYGKDDGYTPYANNSREKLSAANQKLYDALQPVLAEISAGKRSSTQVSLRFSSTSGMDFTPVFYAVGNDFPYELYWFNGMCSWSYTSREYVINFYPATAYRSSSYSDQYPSVNVTKMKKAAAAAEYALDIVRQYANYSDYDKVVAYADTICSLVEYDYDALEGNYGTGNPRGLANVFDRDTSTNVVCEGYAEAFQYLFDLSTFQGNIKCYSVTGANHKWNIVRINDVSYLLDVTHCDYGSYADKRVKFLDGGSGSVEDGYVIGGFWYWYDYDILELWGTGSNSILKLSSKKYTPGATCTHSSYTTVVTAPTCSAQGYTTYTCKSCGYSWKDQYTDPVAHQYDHELDDTCNLCGETRQLGIASGICGYYLNWVMFADGKLVIYGTGDMYDYESEISVPWYGYADRITTVQINAGMTRIGNYAFCNCTNLSDVTIPETVKYIGESAFAVCKKLTTIVLPSTLLAIDKCAFMNSALSEIQIPDQVTKLGEYSFYNCVGSQELVIPDSVTEIGEEAFYGLDNLEKVILPGSLTTLGSHIFYECSGLREVVFSEGLTVIGNSMFHSSGLTQVTIPRSVKTIENFAFGSCLSLATINFSGNAPTFGEKAFNKVVATAYYPNDNATWTSGKLQDYGGTLTWVGVCTNHTPQTIPAVAATCTEEGLTEGSFCARCQAILVPQNAVPALGHRKVTLNGMAATCTNPGLTEGSSCSRCQKILVVQTVIPSLGHNCVTVPAVAATCTQTGLTEGKDCSRCDYTEGRNVIPALGHNEVTDAYKAPTCTDTGLTEGSHCARCFVTLVNQNTIPALGHSFENAVCTVCGAAEVLEGTSWDGLSWKIDENGKLTITGEGAMYYTPWKSYADRICSVEIQTGCTRIYRDAFSNCTNLTKVTMADTVTEIYGGAFEGCTALKTVTMSKNVTEIGASAFEGCSSLTSVTLPKNLAAIEYYTFKDCTSLQAISIPESVKEIGWNAFEGCTSLRSVSISEGLEILESGVFENCTSLSSIILPKTVKEIGGACFSGCTNLRSANIPSGVEIIDYSTFEGCSSLSWITIPATVKEIGSYAFRDCTSLTSVTVPQGVTTLGAGAFRGCTELYSVSLPKSLESVSYDLFANCTSLYDVNIPVGLTELSDWMFSGCESLTEIIIPNTVTTIGRAAFAGCQGLKEITLPASVATLGSRAFTNCNNLKSIKVSSANEFFSSDAYGVVYNKDKTVLVLIPGGLTGSYTIPEGVVIVGKDAVCNGKKLTGITFPGTLTAIEDYAFSNCSALTDAWFKGNAPAIAEYAFEETTLTARYPAGDTTWTAEKLQNYGGSITWVASCVNGHAEVIQPGTPATCVEDGISEGKYCSVCGDVIARQEVIPALGHDVSVNGYAAPTCTEPGHTEGSHCERCGEIFTAAEEIPALGHNKVVDAYLAPTCTEKGLTEGSHCDRCNEVFVPQEVIPALGHDFVDGFCDRCGEPDKADYELFSGKSLTLKPINPDTGKAFTTKQLTWFMDAQYDAFATVKNGKITARVVLTKTRIEVAAIRTDNDEIAASYTIDIFPTVTQLEVFCDGEIVNGKTLNVDFDQQSLDLTADAYPLDTLKNIQWTVSDKKLAYAEDYIIDGNTVTVVNPTGKAGTVTVTAAVTAGVKKTASVKLQFANYAQEVVIETPEETTIEGGESLQLYASVIGDTSKPGITWSIPDKADKTAATVSTKGLLKAKKVKHPQTITVLAVSKDGKAQDSVQITIVPQDAFALYLVSNGQSVTGMTGVLNVGDTSQLTACSQYYREETVTWKSSKPSVATVSSDGLITAVSPGTAKITAEKPGQKAVFVNIKVTTLVSDMTISTKDGKNLVQENGETLVEIASSKGATLAATVYPAKANKAVTWEITEGEEYAKISSTGKITANKDLTSVKYVTVKATAKDGSGYSEAIRVRIRPLATGVQIYSQNNGRTTFSVRTPENWWVRSNTTLEVRLRDTRTLQLLSHVYPYYNDTNDRNAIQGVTWKSSSAKIASVDADGNVTFLKTGTVTITATATDGSNKKVTFKLKIV